MKARRKVAGLHAVEAVLEHSPDKVLAAWADNGRRDSRLARLLDRLSAMGVKTQAAQKNRLDALSEGQAHQGLVIEVLVPEELDENALRTVLEQPVG